MKKCGMCAQAGIESKAVWESEFKLKVFNNPNPIVVYLCAECYSQLPKDDKEAEESLGKPSRSQDHMAKDDFEPLTRPGRRNLCRTRLNTTVSEETKSKIEKLALKFGGCGQVVDAAVKLLK